MFTLLDTHISELKGLEGVTNSAFEAAEAVLADVLENDADEADKLQQLSQLKEVMENLANMEKDIKESKNKSSALKKKAIEQEKAGEEVLDMPSLYQSVSSECSSVRLNSSKTDVLRKLSNEIATLKEVGGEELQVTSNTMEGVKDPLTRQVIVNQVRSRTCGHVFEKESIMEYLKMESKKKFKKCPFPGCTNAKMNMQNLVDSPSYSAKENSSEACGSDVFVDMDTG